jgi:hypothetical protein
MSVSLVAGPATNIVVQGPGTKGRGFFVAERQRGSARRDCRHCGRRSANCGLPQDVGLTSVQQIVINKELRFVLFFLRWGGT